MSIRTSKEDAFKRLLNITTTSASSRRILIEALHFFTTYNQASHLAPYALEFLSPLTEVIEHPSTRYMEPGVFQELQRIASNWDQVLPAKFKQDIERLQSSIKLRHASVLAHLGELKRCLQVLSPQTEIRDDQLSLIYSSGTTAFDFFKALISLRDKQNADELPQLKQILADWNEFLNAGAHAMIVEEEDDYSLGALVSLSVRSITKAVRNKVELLHPLGAVGGSSSVDQLKQALEVATELLQSRTTIDSRFSVEVQLKGTDVALVGKSIGCAGLAAFLDSCSNSGNGKESYKVFGGAAFTGELQRNPNGSIAIAEVDGNGLQKKLTAAFFSPATVVIVPASQFDEAQNLISQMVGEYPRRHLEINGVSEAKQLLERPSAITITHRSIRKRLGFALVQHRTPVFVGLFTLLAVVTGTVWWNAHYNYPNLEIARGLTILSNSIVYNPKAATIWQVRDTLTVVDPTISFGTIELHGHFSRTYEIWNCTPLPLKLKTEITGKDSADYWITWHGGIEEIASCCSLRVTVSFLPHSIGKKQGQLKITPIDHPENSYSVELKGECREATPAGYALHLNGHSEVVIGNDPRLILQQGTIEFWMRPEVVTTGVPFKTFFNVPNGKTIRRYDFQFAKDSTLIFTIGETTVLLPTKTHFTSSKWHHVAATWSAHNQVASLYVDGNLENSFKGNFYINGNDGIYAVLGCDDHGDGKRREKYFNGDLDEFRIWNRVRSANEISDGVNKSVDFADTSLVCYFNFDDANDLLVKDESTNGIRAWINGRSENVVSDVPLESRFKAQPLTFDTNEVACLYSGSRGAYAETSDRILTGHTSATIEYDFKVDSIVTGVETNFVVPQNLDQQLSANITAGHLFLAFAKPMAILGTPVFVTPKVWHHVAITYDSTLQIVRLYYDGNESCHAKMEAPMNWDFRYEGTGFLASAFKYDEVTDAPGVELSEVRFWNVCRSKEEINETTHTAMKGTEAHLISLWNFRNNQSGWITDACDGSRKLKIYRNVRILKEKARIH